MQHTTTSTGRSARPASANRLRVALTTAVVVTATAVPAATASARGDGWQPEVIPAVIDGACGSTAVHLTFPVNKEYHRDTNEPDGTVVSQITGSLTAHFVADTGASLDQNIGGPGLFYQYPNGDIEFHSEGHFNYMVDPTQAAQLGVPQIFSTTGLIDFIQHKDGTMTPVSMPHNVINVCALLGLG